MSTKKTVAAEAEQTAEAKEETVKTEAKTPQTKQTESVYTVEELSGGAKKLFDTRAECVTAALKAAGITECTVSKAKEIVASFMKKEVK